MNRLFILLLVLIASSCFGIKAADEAKDYFDREEKTVYFVTSYNDNNEWNRRVRSSFLARLYKSEFMINIRSIHFDHNSSMTPEARRRVVEAYLTGMNELVDVIVATDYNAVETMLSFDSDERAHIPLVFVSEFDNTALSTDSLADCYGAIGSVAFDEVFKMGRRMLPKTERVYVWGDKTPLGQAYLNEARRQLAKYENEIPIFYGIDAADDHELLKRAAELPENSFVIFTTWTEDDTHRYHNPAYFYPLLTSTATAPMFSVIDCYVRDGFVGGDAISPRLFGEQAADKALEIMRGKATGKGQVEMLGTTPVYSRKALARWGISDEGLPKNTRWLGTPGQSPYKSKQVRNTIMSIVGFFVLVIGVMVVLYRRRKARLDASLFREKLLRQAKERLRFKSDALSTAISSMQEGMVAVGRDKRILECNDAFCNWVGLSYDEIIGTDLPSICEFSGLNEVWRMLESHRDEGFLQYTIKPSFLLSQNGVSRYVQGQAYALGGGADEEPTGIVFLLYDIIDEMRRENIRSLTIKSFDAFSWSYDVSADRFAFGENSPVQADGSKFKTQKDMSDRIHPKDRERVRQYFHDCVVSKQKEFSVTFRLDLAGDGEFAWRECRGVIETSTVAGNRTITYLYGLNICVAELKRYQAYVAQIQHIADVAGREARIGYAHYNLRTGVGSASEQWFDNLNIPQEARVGYDFRNVYNSIAGDDRDQIMRFYVQAMCGQRTRYQGDNRVAAPDGTSRWVHNNKVVVVNDDGEFEMIEINYDVSLRMNEVDRLRALLEKHGIDLSELEGEQDSES